MFLAVLSQKHSDWDAIVTWDSTYLLWSSSNYVRISSRIGLVREYSDRLTQ